MTNFFKLCNSQTKKVKNFIKSNEEMCGLIAHCFLDMYLGEYKKTQN